MFNIAKRIAKMMTFSVSSEIRILLDYSLWFVMVGVFLDLDKNAARLIIGNFSVVLPSRGLSWVFDGFDLSWLWPLDFDGFGWCVGRTWVSEVRSSLESTPGWPFGCCCNSALCKTKEQLFACHHKDWSTWRNSRKIDQQQIKKWV